MKLHSSTFDYLKPTDTQVASAHQVREAAKVFSRYLETYLPDGPDKTYALRTFRTVVMWAIVSITRTPDGTPRPPAWEL